MAILVFEIHTDRSSYLRLFINDSLYEHAFRDFREMKTWFAKNRKHLRGNPFPEIAIDTLEISRFGHTDSHRVLKTDLPDIYLVMGPHSKIWDYLFKSKTTAEDFATVESGKYDNL